MAVVAGGGLSRAASSASRTSRLGRCASVHYGSNEALSPALPHLCITLSRVSGGSFAGTSGLRPRRHTSGERSLFRHSVARVSTALDAVKALHSKSLRMKKK